MACRPSPSPWYEKATAVLFAIFCFEMGLFLVLFPWYGPWDVNHFAWLGPQSSRAIEWAHQWRGIWLSPYFRGAVSGLGVLNIWIAIQEAYRLRRFARPDESSADEQLAGPDVPIK